MTRSIVSPQYEQLRRLLVQARKAAHLTQEAVAARLGRPQSFVAKYEGGERRLDVIEFIEVARALGAEPARIVRKLAASHAQDERR